jgi:hypothetical protein
MMRGAEHLDDRNKDEHWNMDEWAKGSSLLLSTIFDNLNARRTEGVFPIGSWYCTNLLLSKPVLYCTTNLSRMI